MFSFILAFLVCVLAPLPAVVFESSAVPADGEYVLYITPYDFEGCADKIVVNIGKEVLESDVRKDDFEVSVVLGFDKSAEEGYGVVRSERTVKSAYISDSQGLPSVSPASRFITLKLEVSPDDEYSSPFIRSAVLNAVKTDTLYSYRIVNSSLSFKTVKRSAVVSQDAAMFKTGEFTFKNSGDDDEISMEYAEFVPRPEKPLEKQRSRKIPLVVFFHGMGESGRDISKPLFSIKTTALARKKIQDCFGSSGAAVLIPQCPTGWLEITELDPFGNRLWVAADIRSPVRKLKDSISKFLSSAFSFPDSQDGESATPVSYYTFAVKALIDKTVADNPEIDTSRIYIGGSSAGGFMAVNMMIQYPDFFAAAFPVCEAFPDTRINSSDIKKLSGKPLWFVVSRSDTTIAPDKYTFPTVERLENAGARNLHHTYFDKVVDTSGLFLCEDKSGPYEYDGHDSWIYVFNDEVCDGNLRLFDWLARQRNGD